MNLIPKKVPLPRFVAAHAPSLAAAIGSLGGGLYTLQSASHMVVTGPYDILVVGLLLALIGAGIGWLCAVIAAKPLRGSVPAVPRSSRDVSGNHAGAEPATERAAVSGARQSQT